MQITQYKTILSDGKCELVKEKTENYDCQNMFNSPHKIFDMLCDVFQHNKRTEEYMYLLCFDAKLKLLGIFELSHGTITKTICEPREIFQKALLCNANSIVLAHNHPSGDVSLSKNDIESYEEVKQASEIMGIKLLDSIIVGDGYCSLAREIEKVNETKSD